MMKRAKSLAQNVSILGPVLGGSHRAFSYLLSTRGNNAAEEEATYKSIPFRFRRGDLPAIREILGKKEYGFLEDYLKSISRPVVYDIGAHIGLFAIWVLSVNPQAEIHSIEASPETYKITTANVQRAGLKGYNWKAENRAAWKEEGFVRFANSSHSTMSHRIDSGGGVEVPAFTLAGIPKHVDLMKIDIEGAEESFLGDGADLAGIGRVVIEVHPQYCNADNVTRALRRNYKQVENFNKRPGSKPLLYCRN